MSLRRLCVPLLLLAASSLHATIITYTAILNGLNESPPNASPGTGNATVVVDDFLNTLSVSVTFFGLTTNSTAAHIHCCTSAPQTGTAAVATQVPYFVGFPIGFTSGSYVHVFDMTDSATWNPTFITANGGTAAGAEAALLAGLAAGEAYLNIHTTQYPAGEIRGFLVPEPATSGLVGLALISLACFRRHRS